MSVTTSYVFSFVDYLGAIGDGQKDVDVVSTGDGFAISTTHLPNQSALDIYNGSADPTGNTAAVTTGANSGIDRLANGNLVTVGQGDGNLFYTIKSATGSDVLAGSFGEANARDADVAVLRNNFPAIPSFFVTAYTKQFSSESDVLIDIRKPDGSRYSSFAIDPSSDYSDYDAHIVALGPPSLSNGFATGGFAVLYDRHKPVGPMAIGGTDSLMYAVYNADGSVRKAPTAIFTQSNTKTDGDIVASGSGFAMTWIDPSTGDLKLEVLNSNGTTVFNGGPTTILAAGNDILSKPTITTLSNGYFGIAVESFDTTSLFHGKKLVMANDTFTGIHQLYADDYYEGGTNYNMDSAGFGTGRMVVAGDTATQNSTQAQGFVVEGRRTSTGDTANDVITGDDFHDSMNGGGGNDVLSGAGNTDSLDGADGNDTLDGGTGNDYLTGGIGDDMLVGGTGTDDMKGGANNDRYVVDTVTDKVTENANEGYDTIDTSLNTYTLGANMERVNFTGSMSIVGVGNTLDNRFQSGAGDDRFVDVAGGADTFSGGTGDDAVDFRSSTTGATINLATGVHGGAATGDFYASIEKFYGSNTAADTMKAGSGKASFSGYGGADTLIGGNYADKLLGGADADKLYGGNATDTLQGGEGNDTLNGGKDADVFLFIEPKFGADAITDFQDGTDTLRFYHTVADSAADFTVSGNGSSHVTVTLAADPTNRITIDGYGGANVTIDSHDFMFY